MEQRNYEDSGVNWYAETDREKNILNYSNAST